MKIYVLPFKGDQWIDLDQWLLIQEKEGPKTGAWRDFATLLRTMLEQQRIEIRTVVKI